MQGAPCKSLGSRRARGAKFAGKLSNLNSCARYPFVARGWLNRDDQTDKAMNKALGLALLAVGIVLLIFGINGSQSFGSDVSRFFTGSPTDKSIWLMIGGVVALIVGGFFTMSRSAKW